MRFLLTLTLLILTLAHARAASLAQAVLYTTDTSGTNARPSAVTITPSTAGTNLNAGVLNATNDVRLNGTSIVIWTNSAGTISATSTVADGGPAFSLTTSNALTSGNLFELKDMGTNRVTIDTQGSVSISSDNYGYVYLANGDGTYLILSVDSLAGAGPQLNIYDGTHITQFAPGRLASQTTYTLDTAITHTSGNLLEVKNNGTNRFVATYAGSLIYNLRAANSVAGTLSSGSTIAPTAPITFVSGTTTIDTITAPAPISSTGGQITLIPTGVWSTSTSGNVALATTAVVSKALILTYDQATAKWYPSY